MNKLNPAYVALILASLQVLKIPYIFNYNYFWIKKDSLTTKMKESCIKFIKDRLKFTDRSKLNKYKDANPSIKERYNE
jgi:hypothetical protein